jgi:menaquinone-9 beta-reductase
VRREPLIIGAGPAGSAAAIRLGQAGYRPRLIERAAAPTDKVCGDFLGADAIERLHALGVDPAGLGAAPIHRLHLIHRHRETMAELPFRALGLSRKVLDQALLARAEAAGARVLTGTQVRRLSRTPHGWLAHTADVDPFAADGVFLATGKHDLRDLSRPGVAAGAIGMKMYYRLTPTQTAALSGAVVLTLFPDGYAGLQCVEGGRAVLCVAVGRGGFQAVGGTWSAMLAALEATSPQLREMLAGADPLLSRPLAIAGVPYGFLRKTVDDRTLFRVGDQAAVIPSLTGDGIAIALHSGTLAAGVWLDGDNASAYHHRLAHDLGGQMRLARVLHNAAMTGALQPVIVRGAGWFPGLLRQAARGTRLRGSAPTRKGLLLRRRGDQGAFDSLGAPGGEGATVRSATRE